MQKVSSRLPILFMTTSVPAVISNMLATLFAMASAPAVGNNKPCTNPDGAPKANRLCQGTVKNMPIFSDTNSQVVSFNCAATLTKGKKYWVLIVAPPDADLAWNFSSSAQAGIVLGHNDRWGAYQSHNSTGALTIQ